MPYLNGPISARGPLVSLRVDVSAPRALALRNAGQAVPGSVELQGLVDTGADCTFIDTRHVPFLVQQLPTMTLVGSPVGSWTAGLQYDISLAVLHPLANRRLNL